MAEPPLVSRGVHEFVFGADVANCDALLAFWAKLGFAPSDEAMLSRTQASAVYGHAAELTSIRLVHPGCSTYATGYVRLQLWSTLSTQGLGNIRPLTTGSRWMGMYTHDILQLHDSFASAQDRSAWNLWLSPLVSAPLAKPAPSPSFFEPFVGLRELLVFGDDFRLAFIQRAGFDRPGFGTFDDTLAFKNTEGSHANVVQPDNQFCSEFYKAVFDFETAPFGDAHDTGDDEATIAALSLKVGERFRVERLRAADCPTGLVQVYSSYSAGQDMRDKSRIGSRNLCLYSVLTRDIDELARRICAHGGTLRGEQRCDEFGAACVYFDAADGYSWLAIQAP